MDIKATYSSTLNVAHCQYNEFLLPYAILASVSCRCDQTMDIVLFHQKDSIRCSRRQLSRTFITAPLWRRRDKLPFVKRFTKCVAFRVDKQLVVLQYKSLFSRSTCPGAHYFIANRTAARTTVVMHRTVRANDDFGLQTLCKARQVQFQHQACPDVLTRWSANFRWLPTPPFQS